MKVLLVGGGGREHAIAWSLAKSPRLTKLYAVPGNAGIAEIAECVPIPATDIDGIANWAEENAMDFVVVAPDDPLALGLVDELEKNGIAAFGPAKAAAKIEWSKIFSKDLMMRHNIPTANYATFTDFETANAYVNDRFKAKAERIVVKADGLALGKGAIICVGAAASEAALRSMMVEGRFRDAGKSVVIEEFLTGREVTVLCFTDGKTIVPMPALRDHKRAYDGDKGPNTGGMGAVTPVWDYTPEIAAESMSEIFLPTIDAMRLEGYPFSGVLYINLILTENGPKVIEYNARFGDPEAQVVLPLLKTDLLEIMLACREGTLDKLTIEWDDAACAGVVVASGGYPGNYPKGLAISGLARLSKDTIAFHAGTAFDQEGGIVTNGGRVLCVTAKGQTPKEALDCIYGEIDKIKFDGAFYRKDIGATSIAPDVKKLRALVVDDDDISLMVAKEILRSLDVEADTVNRGEKAAKICKMKRYDVIFIDHLMPGMDGLETVKLLRTITDVPLVAVSANEDADALDFFRKNGFTEFLHKPLEFAPVEKMIKKLL